MDSRPVEIFNEEVRRPTNTVWNYPFLGAVITFFVLAAAASQTTGPEGLVSGRLNNESSQCGIDSDVLYKKLRIRIDDRRYVELCDYLELGIDECNNHWICVKSCPHGGFDAETCTAANFQEHHAWLVCQADHVKARINNCNELQSAVADQKCVAWYEDTYELFGRCVSRKSTKTDDVDIQAIEANTGHIILSLVPSFVYSIVIAGVVSIFFIVTLKWSAAFVFWSFVMLIIIGLILLIIFVMYVGSKSDDQKEVNDMYTQLAIVIFWFLLCLLCLYRLRKKIDCGIEVVKESSRCVCASFGSIFFTFLPFLLRAVTLITTCYIGVMAITLVDNHYEVTGKDESSDCTCKNNPYVNGDSCIPETFNTDCQSSKGGLCTDAVCKLTRQDDSNLSTPLFIFTLCIAVWILAFIQANAKMVLAHVYGNWYWSWERTFIPPGAISTAMSIVWKNHTGTAAFGGFVIMVCRMLRSFLKRRDRRGCGLLVRILVSMIQCCAQIFLELVEFISDKAFVVCAIMGYGFWDSVKTVSKIMVRDAPLVVATEWVGDVILFVCKFVAAIASTWLFCATSPFKGDDLFITIIGAIVIFIFAFDLAAVLLTAYNVAIDTLLICTLQDFMHSGQEKAYFRSETLNALLLSHQQKDMV